MRIGDAMLSAGMSANDVVVLMLRHHHAYGLRRVHVDVTFTAISASYRPGPGLAPVTAIRVVHPDVVDYSKVRQLDRLHSDIEARDAHRRGRRPPSTGSARRPARTRAGSRRWVTPASVRRFRCCSRRRGRSCSSPSSPTASWTGCWRRWSAAGCRRSSGSSRRPRSSPSSPPVSPMPAARCRVLHRCGPDARRRRRHRHARRRHHDRRRGTGRHRRVLRHRIGPDVPGHHAYGRHRRRHPHRARVAQRLGAPLTISAKPIALGPLGYQFAALPLIAALFTLWAYADAVTIVLAAGHGRLGWLGYPRPCGSARAASWPAPPVRCGRADHHVAGPADQRAGIRAHQRRAAPAGARASRSTMDCCSSSARPRHGRSCGGRCDAVSGLRRSAGHCGRREPGTFLGRPIVEQLRRIPFHSRRRGNGHD